MLIILISLNRRCKYDLTYDETKTHPLDRLMNMHKFEIFYNISELFVMFLFDRDNVRQTAELLNNKTHSIVRYPSWNQHFQSPRYINSGGSRGGLGGSNEPPLEPKVFHFHGKFQENLVKLHKSNPALLIRTPDPKILDPPLIKIISFNMESCSLDKIDWTIFVT